MAILPFVATAILLCAATLVGAQNSVCTTTFCSGVPSCSPSALAAGANMATNVGVDAYKCCMPTSASSTTCVVDPCISITSADTCLGTNSNNCAVVPGSGSSNVCVNRQKLCWSLSSRYCSKYSFCSIQNGICDYVLPSVPASFDEGSVASKCPALHPMVVAMLALMFLTFVGGVVLVAVVVIRNQKQADEEESRAEAAAAAEAEASRARRQRGL